jgi:hypothetical protein
MMTVKLSDINLWDANYRQGDVAMITASIQKFGYARSVALWTDNTVIAGNHTIKALQALEAQQADVPNNVDVIDGDWHIDVTDVSHLDDREAQAYGIADNRTADSATNDDEQLASLLTQLQDEPDLLKATGYDDDDIAELLSGLMSDDESHDGEDTVPIKLTERFVVPPFSVLDARQGYWQDRKRQWLAVGIKSELGRGKDLVSSRRPEFHDYRNGATSNALASTFKNSTQQNQGEDAILTQDNGTSIFDPVICELAYLWFSPVGASVIDPFAGGSVRGIVASKLGRDYTGIDLSEPQIIANREQATLLTPDSQPNWIVGDSSGIDSLVDDTYDLFFTCPPYADLEVYSDHPSDISNMAYADFLPIYRDIINKSCQLLNDDRFAVIVVGEVRDKKGHYYNFVGDTVTAFLDAGLVLYNEAILVTALGTVMMQASRNFPIGRKLGKTHQNVLVFLKGDSKRAVEFCGDVEIVMPADEGEESEYGVKLDLS